MMKRLLNTLKRGLQHTAKYYTGELKESLRDNGTIIMFVVGMIAYPVAYSLGYVKEVVREIPVALVDLDHSNLSRQYSRMADATEQIHITHKPASLQEAEDLFYDGKVYGVILVPAGFERSVYRKEQTSVTVYSDAGHFLLYKQVYAAGVYSSQTLGAGIQVKDALMNGKTWQQAANASEPLRLNVYNLYNPSGGYGTFIVPGILIIVIQQTLLIGIGLLWSKHTERKSYHYLEDAISQRWAPLKIVMGQCLAYVSIYLITSFLILGIFYHIVDFPDKSGFWPCLYLLIPYLFTVSFAGMAIGILFKKRVHALLFIVFLSPVIFFISGAAWPEEALPPALKWLANIIPSTPVVNAFIRVRIFGSGLHSVWHEYQLMITQLVTYFLLCLFACWYKLRNLKKELALS